MIASKHSRDADFAHSSEESTRNEEAVLALTKAQNLAASRLAVAQGVLEQAYDLQAQLTQERDALAGFLSVAGAAQNGEQEAAARAQRSRERLETFLASRAAEERRHAELRDAERLSRAELEAAETRLVLARQTLEAASAAYADHRIEPAADSDAEATMRLELEQAGRSLEEHRRARLDANASIEEICARLELLSGGSGLSAEAVIRVIERRTADQLRHGTKYGTT